MSRHATFENFGMAFLTLFQVSTGDNWNGIMKVQSCIQKHSVQSLTVRYTARWQTSRSLLNICVLKGEKTGILKFLSSTLLTDEKDLCLLSTGGTDFLTEWLCLTPISPEHTSTARGYDHFCARLGCKGNRDYTGACRAWTIKHTLDTGSVDSCRPWSKPAGHRCYLSE